MDESFDMWRRKKTQNDYARFFDEWHERDLSDLILRDRNHPSILMWSIGNEVLEQWSSAEADTLTLEQANLILNAGHDASTLAKDGELSVQSLLTQHLAEIVKKYDTSRPIMAGCNEPSPNNHLFKSGAIDVIGFNYHHQWVKDVPQNFPGKPFIFSESVSALQTRGFYMMPSDSIYVAPKEWWLPYTDPTYMCSAYDNMHASWSSTHEETWDVVKHTPYVGGQFIWTGFDYIGEPTPYGFPARSSYFGIIDLAGFPKDSYYMYQSEWTQKPMLHLFPHWNWVPGDYIDMWCYYNNADEVELFINGESQGVKRKNTSKDDPLCTEYHVGWRVTFDPGEVKAVSRKDGKVVCEQTIKTAGAPDHVRLSIDYQGKETTFITAEVVDKDGNLCPWAEDKIYFIDTKSCSIVNTIDGHMPGSGYYYRLTDVYPEDYLAFCADSARVWNNWEEGETWYLDFNTQEKFQMIPEYEEYEILAYNGDYFCLSLENDIGTYYLAVVDKTGKTVYSPVQYNHNSRFKPCFWGDHLIYHIDGELCFVSMADWTTEKRAAIQINSEYDTNERMCLTDIASPDVKYIIDFDTNSYYLPDGTAAAVNMEPDPALASPGVFENKLLVFHFYDQTYSYLNNDLTEFNVKY